MSRCDNPSFHSSTILNLDNQLAALALSESLQLVQSVIQTSCPTPVCQAMHQIGLRLTYVLQQIPDRHLAISRSEILALNRHHQQTLAQTLEFQSHSRFPTR